MTPPEVIWLLDEIRNAVREMDSENEDSIEQIPALRKIVRASVEALSQLEARKDVTVRDILMEQGLTVIAYQYENSMQVEEKS